jgi:catechol 2,3-dioxygenase-like lactoylglutathione lyase family enzyme
MKFTGICLITGDVLRLAGYYERLFGVEIEKDAVHTTFEAFGLDVALYSQRAAETDMGFDFGTYGGTGKMTIGFNVDDVDAEYERLKSLGVEFVTRPRTYPWGARSVHFRDPDGNIICFRTIPK